MRVFLKIAVSFCLVASWGGAAAALYKWVDEDGVTHFTTTAPPESSVRGREVLNKKGRTIKKIRGERTAAEKAEEARLASEKARQKKNKKAEERKDHLVLITYMTKEDIIAKRDATLGSLDDQISRMVKKQEEVSEEYHQLMAEVVKIEREGGLPSQLDRGGIAGSKRELDDYGNRVASLSKKRGTAAEGFAEDARRFKRLKGIKD